MSAFWQALLAATSAPGEPPILLRPFTATKYDDRDRSYLTYFPAADWWNFDHGAFYAGTLTRLAADQGGNIAQLSFQLACSGQPDEGFDIGGVVEYLTIRVYANDQLLTSVTGYAGGDLVQIRCGPGGLATKPKRYTIRVERDPPADFGNGRSLYIDYVKTYSRAIY